MGILDKLLAAPFKGVIEAVGSLIDSVTTTDEEKREAKAKLVALQLQGELELARVDAQFAEMQSRVVIAEAQSESFLARNWRPILMLTFTFIIAWNYVLSPIFSQPRVPIPPDMWELLKLGVGGYIVGRSVEKVATTVKNGNGRKLT